MSNKPALRKGWLRASFREMQRRAGTSLLISVVLLPTFIAQIVTMTNEQFTTGPVLTVVALLVAIALALHLAWSARRHVREVTGLVTNKLGADELASVSGVVTIVSNMNGPREKAYQVLARQVRERELPALRTIYAITCPGEDEQAGLLRDWALTMAPEVRVLPMHVQVDRHRPADATVEALANELKLLPQPGTVVDLTTDNALCTVILYSAAREAGMPVSFLASSSPTHPWQSEFALVAIQDPHGMFDSVEDSSAPALAGGE